MVDVTLNHFLEYIFSCNMIIGSKSFSFILMAILLLDEILERIKFCLLCSIHLCKVHSISRIIAFWHWSRSNLTIIVQILKPSNVNFMPCQNQCSKHKASKPGQGSRYAAGQKYCSYCCLFVNWDGSRCPCCHYQLKTKSRNSKYKIDAKRI